MIECSKCRKRPQRIAMCTSSAARLDQVSAFPLTIILYLYYYIYIYIYVKIDALNAMVGITRSKVVVYHCVSVYLFELKHAEIHQDASAPESSEKFVKVMCQQSGQSFLGPGSSVSSEFPEKNTAGETGYHRVITGSISGTTQNITKRIVIAVVIVSNDFLRGQNFRMDAQVFFFVSAKPRYYLRRDGFRMHNEECHRWGKRGTRWR